LESFCFNYFFFKKIFFFKKNLGKGSHNKKINKIKLRFIANIQCWNSIFLFSNSLSRCSLSSFCCIESFWSFWIWEEKVDSCSRFFLFNLSISSSKLFFSSKSTVSAFLSWESLYIYFFVYFCFKIFTEIWKKRKRKKEEKKKRISPSSICNNSWTHWTRNRSCRNFSFITFFEKKKELGLFFAEK